MRALLLVIAGGAVALIHGCSDDNASPNNGASCKAYEVPAGTDLTTPAVSFTNDVMPIFRASCGLSASCHGAPGNGNQADLFLGSDAAKVHTQTVGKASTTLPRMPRVTPGDPGNSFLMHKLDHDHCLLNSECTKGTCGDGMPEQGDLLDVTTRDKVRRWIAQGAKND